MTPEQLAKAINAACGNEPCHQPNCSDFRTGMWNEYCQGRHDTVRRLASAGWLKEPAPTHGEDTAKSRIQAVLPYLLYASELVTEDGGTLKLGILSAYEDGSGKVEAKFDAQDFITDLVSLCDWHPLTQDERLNCAASKIASFIRPPTPGGR